MIKRIIKRIQRFWKHTPFGKTKKNDNPIRWGVIGLGYMAETFCNAIDGNKNGVVYAVASRSLQKAKTFALRHGKCKAYGSYQEMINDKQLELDVVYIATPVKYHYEHIKICLEAGLNVLCEKPIASTIEQLEELKKIANLNNCFLMEGMWMKCLPSFQKACQWIHESKIGTVELVKVDFYKREHIRQNYAIYNAKEGGGILYDFGVYAIAFMEHFLNGFPEKIFECHRYSSHGIDADWCIVGEKDGIKCCVNISSNFGSLSKAAVIGSKGVIEWNSQFNRTNRVTLYNENGLVIETYAVSYRYEGFEYEVEEVQNCIRKRKCESSLVTFSGSYNTLKIIDSLMKNGFKNEK